jgi:mono/diheme cytochrome c family protein
MKRALLTLILTGLASLLVASCGSDAKEIGANPAPHQDDHDEAAETHESDHDEAAETHDEDTAGGVDHDHDADHDAPAIEAAPVVSDADMALAQARFDTACAACHGKTGEGDGLAAAAMDPKPRKYSDKAWQATVTNEYLAKIITEGGPAVGKSVYMSGAPDLKDQPGVINGLVAIVRGFAK